jgi:hypothetical protein
MKKQITTVATAIALGLFTANAQDLTSKKGEPILPEEGDWGIGVDATPFLDYAGNFFGKNASNTAPTWNFLTTANQVIVGKYFKDATTAYRAGIRLGLTNQSIKVLTGDRSYVPPSPAPSNPAPEAYKTVENSAKYSTTNIGISGGIEFRKGKTRLQGYYGGDVGLFFGSSKDVYTYGNALNPTGSPAVVVSATGDDIDGTNVVSIPIANYQSGLARVTERKTSGIFQFGIRGFIGAEYFILPKISIGGEFGWGIGFASNGKTTITYETQTGAGANTQAGKVTYTQKNGSGFLFDTDNSNHFWGPSGSLRLNLYF